MSGVTKATVESAIHSLNDKAEQLGLERRFSMQFGSGVTGVQHALEEEHPALSHPSVTKIGKTLAEAYGYVLAMNHAYASALLDRRHRRSAAMEGRDTNGFPLGMVSIDPGRTVGIAFDPDARDVRRAGEEV